jgi:hypothetical protein
MVGTDTPDRSAKSSCDHDSSARAALICRIDIFSIDTSGPQKRYIYYQYPDYGVPTMPDACVSAAAPGLPSTKMPPALAAHLENMHVQAIYLNRVAKALRQLIDVDIIDPDLLTDLLDVILKQSEDMDKGLYAATLQKLPA